MQTITFNIKGENTLGLQNIYVNDVNMYFNVIGGDSGD